MYYTFHEEVEDEMEGFRRRENKLAATAIGERQCMTWLFSKSNHQELHTFQ